MKTKKLLTISSILSVSLPLFVTFSCNDNSNNQPSPNEIVNKFIENMNISIIPEKESDKLNTLPSQITTQSLSSWFNIPTSNSDVKVEFSLSPNDENGSLTINVTVSSTKDPNVKNTKTYIFDGFKNNQLSPEEIVNNFISNVNVSLKPEKESEKANTLPSQITTQSLSSWFNLPSSNEYVNVSFELTSNDQAGSLKVSVKATSKTNPNISRHIDFSFNGFKKVEPVVDSEKLVNDYINTVVSKVTIKESQKPNQANTLASTINKNNLSTWFDIPTGNDKVKVEVVEVIANDSAGTLKITFKVSSGTYYQNYSITQSGFKIPTIPPVIDYEKEVNNFIANINISLKTEKHNVIQTTLASTIKETDLSAWFDGLPASNEKIIVSLTSLIPNDEVGKLTFRYNVKYETASKDYTFVQTGFEQKEISQPSDYTYRPNLSQQIPVINVTLDQGTTVDQLTKAYTRMTISVNDPNNVYSPLTNLPGQIKVRGNSTSEYIKKPYRIKLDTKSSMLGLNKNNAFKDWVLLAEWRDPSFLRNGLGFYLGQLLYKPKGLYSSDFRLIELNINGQYQGLYVLCEQNEVNKNRVDINKPEVNSTDVNIGYLIEMDGSYAHLEDPNEVINLNYYDRKPLLDENGNDVVNSSFLSPSYEYVIKSKTYLDTTTTPPTAPQKNFIGKYLENIYRICYKAIIENEFWEFNADKTNIVQSSRFSDKFSTIKNVVDVDSVVAMIILQEIACNFDVNNSSFYLSIDLSPTGNGKLKFQAPWDFDVSFGTEQAMWLNEIQPDGLFAVNAKNPWITLMYKSDEIKYLIKSKWKEMIDNNVPQLLIDYLDECSTLYINQFKKNFDKWKNIGSYIQTRYDQLKDTTLPERKSWADLFHRNCPESALNVETQEQAKEYLKSWLIARLKTLDTIWRKIR